MMEGMMFKIMMVAKVGQIGRDDDIINDIATMMI